MFSYICEYTIYTYVSYKLIRHFYAPSRRMQSIVGRAHGVFAVASIKGLSDLSPSRRMQTIVGSAHGVFAVASINGLSDMSLTDLCGQRAVLRLYLEANNM